MMKPIASLVAAAMLLAPMASAGETTPITVDIAYDKAMLATEAGAAEVLKSIKSQAKAACTTYSASASGFYTDSKCTKSVVASAVSKIKELQAQEGLAASGTFASNDVMVLADAEQR